jgi:uncharacterized protein YdeI (YjbR/CyaY-like superfamily)
MLESQTDPRVDAYIEEAAPFAQPILTLLRGLMHKACPRATESVKWGMPFFIQQGVILCHMAAFKQHCAFGFWGPQMKKILARDGRNLSDAMGSLGRITALKDLPPDKVLLGYMCQATELVESGERRKSIDRPNRPVAKKIKIPAELAAALKKNKLAAKAFATFSPSCKREYTQWIAQAKRPETKQKRLAEAIKRISQGQTRYWRYEKH